MIERINLNSVNSEKSNTPRKTPQFGGIGDGLLLAIQACEQNPMLNVTVLDLSTAILPRTYIESKTNGYAGFEAFRRESSGLIVNCLIPSFIVWGIAKLLEKPIMGRKSLMGSSWANEDSSKLVADYWKNAKGATNAQKVKNTLKNMVESIYGVDGNAAEDGLKSFADKKYNFDSSYEKWTDAICHSSAKSKEQIKKLKNDAYNHIVNQTHISEHIKFGKDGSYFSKNFKSTMNDACTILKEFVDNGIHEAKDIDKFVTRSKRLINSKSILGLLVIIPLAISMQPLNRWITAKTSGKKGAPIYKDYKDSEERKLSPEEKSGLFKQKLISVGSMIGVSLLSMMKIPKWGMFQFKGIFPTMDQARLISTATFASRMMASEDKNELREATVRDIATFLSFYFLGDYAAKLAATVIQKVKPDIKLLNKFKSNDGANVFQKLWNWVKHTELKSSDEVVGKAAKNMRSVCQLANIGLSLLLLGIIIPTYYRRKTDKKHEEELRQKGVAPEVIQKYYPPFAMNNTQFASKSNVYNAFFTSK